MCGISGIVSVKKSLNINEEVIKEMLSKIKHRGPDADGIYKDKKTIFINARLKIIDLSDSANQPFEYKKFIIVYNGEIYNFKELRSMLLKKGHQFNTNSDTEVILHLYEEYGIKFLEYLNGMFAFAILNKETEEILFARDRLGIKPFFYSFLDNSTLVFGSNIPTILSSKLIKPSINVQGISSYLSFRYEIGEQTVYREIKKLLPGHYMMLKDRELKIKQYWELPMKKLSAKEISYKKAKNKILRKLENSIRYRMISDVPLGAYLSGGVDSSAVVSIMSKYSTEKIKTYTIGFSEENEFDFARIVANKYNTLHKEITIDTETFFRTLIELIREKGAPLGVPNEIPLYIMSKELRKDITVVLSGEGADELFYGYGKIFKLYYDYKRLKKKGFFSNIFYKKIKEKYKDWDTKTFSIFFVQRYSYVSFHKKSLIFKEKIWENDLQKDRFCFEFFENMFKDVSTMHPQDQVGYVFLKVHLPNLLMRVDNSTMATSVEGRVPFLDHDLVEYAFQLPRKYKIKWKSVTSRIRAVFKTSNEISEIFDVPKRILKDIMSDYLPKTILFRSKKGFPVPLSIWFKGEAKNIALNILSSKVFKEMDLFNIKQVKNLIENFDGSYNDAYLIWLLINLFVWYGLFIRNITTEEIIKELTAFKNC